MTKPYPNNCNHEEFNQYVGQQVVNVHNTRTGTLVGVDKGCNGLLCVQWSDYLNWNAQQDLALASTYPTKRWPHLE